MSKMMIRSRKPPLPKSPVRLVRPVRAVRTTQPTTQSQSASLIRVPLATQNPNIERQELGHKNYNALSSDFQALAKMVRDENLSGFVERGKFYDEYSARRNERLKRKRGQSEDEKENFNDLDFKVESAKKAASNMRQVAKRAALETPMTEIRKEKEVESVEDFGFVVESAKKMEREVSKMAVVSSPMAESRKEKGSKGGICFGVESAKKTAPNRRQVAKRVVVSTPMTEKENNGVNDFSFRVESAKKPESARRQVAKRGAVSTPIAENDLGFRVESAKKPESARRQVAKRGVVSTPIAENDFESAKKPESERRQVAKRGVVSTPVAENGGGNSRYNLRSRIKKPPLPVKYEDFEVTRTRGRRN